MTRAQNVIEFVPLQATVPVGMIRDAEGLITYAEQTLGRRMSVQERRIGNNSMLEDDFYAIGEPILEETGLDYLVGVTPSMIAFLIDSPHPRFEWDYLSGCSGRLAIVSAFDLRKFARETRRPHDVFLGVLIVAQVLVAMFAPKLHFHNPDRGCLFDFNEDRARLKDSVRNLRIDSECLAVMPPEYQKAAEALVALLRRYGKKP